MRRASSSEHTERQQEGLALAPLPMAAMPRRRSAARSAWPPCPCSASRSRPAPTDQGSAAPSRRAKAQRSPPTADLRRLNTVFAAFYARRRREGGLPRFKPYRRFSQVGFVAGDDAKWTPQASGWRGQRSRPCRSRSPARPVPGRSSSCRSIAISTADGIVISEAGVCYSRPSAGHGLMCPHAHTQFIAIRSSSPTPDDRAPAAAQGAARRAREPKRSPRLQAARRRPGDRDHHVKTVRHW